MTPREDEAELMGAAEAPVDRDLQRLGRRVARTLAEDAGSAVAKARRELFEAGPERRGAPRAWVLVAGAVCVGAAAFALLRDPDAIPSTAARGGAPPEATEGRPSPLRPGPEARSHQSAREGGAIELVLESGDARGRLGSATGPHALLAGPYRVTGEATLVARWHEAEGLTIEVSEGEARVLTPGQAPRIVAAGASRHFPPRP